MKEGVDKLALIYKSLIPTFGSFSVGIKSKPNVGIKLFINQNLQCSLMPLENIFPCFLTFFS